MTANHPTGMAPGDPAKQCGTCSWFHDGCIAAVPYGAAPFPIRDDTPACDRHEQLTSCDPCGACCREAFDAVPADGGSLPERLVHDWSDDFRTVRRTPQGRGTRCVCLFGDGRNHPFRCTHYPHRPTACRELEIGSANCLLARRRVGLSSEP